MEDGRILTTLGLENVPLITRFLDNALENLRNSTQGEAGYALFFAKRANDFLLDVLREGKDMPDELHITVFEDLHFTFTTERILDEDMPKYLESVKEHREAKASFFANLENADVEVTVIEVKIGSSDEEPKPKKRWFWQS